MDYPTMKPETQDRLMRDLRFTLAEAERFGDAARRHTRLHMLGFTLSEHDDHYAKTHATNAAHYARQARRLMIALTAAAEA